MRLRQKIMNSRRHGVLTLQFFSCRNLNAQIIQQHSEIAYFNVLANRESL